MALNPISIYAPPRPKGGWDWIQSHPVPLTAVAPSAGSSVYPSLLIPLARSNPYLTYSERRLHSRLSEAKQLVYLLEKVRLVRSRTEA